MNKLEVSVIGTSKNYKYIYYLNDNIWMEMRVHYSVLSLSRKEIIDWIKCRFDEFDVHITFSK